VSTRAPTKTEPEAPSGPTGRWSRRRDVELPARLAGVPGRRSLPYLLTGLLLVLGCAAGGVVVATEIGHRQSVLVLAHPVAVGEQLADQDVREASISMDNGLSVIPARLRPEVVGRALAYTLPAGALLTMDVLGSPQIPPVGQAVTALGLKAGQFPPELSAGALVTVVATSASSQTDGTTNFPSSTWNATVTGIHADPGEQLTEVSLQLPQDDARQLAAASTGQISVVMVHGDAQ
jgi:hypothetical protein